MQTKQKKTGMALLREIRETDAVAYRALQAKARWEHMSLLAVLEDWPSYGVRVCEQGEPTWGNDAD